ncbi:MAG TPA: cytochrome c biogenesis protein CcdA [Bryobacteraceae bacterium]|nr:cytochrome c biogenesis protein CcdA [Bryobacteraceae bacterium]
MAARRCRVLLLLAVLPALARAQENVAWSLSFDRAAAAPGSQVVARLEGRIGPGWHLYSMTSAGAIPTTIKVAPNAAVQNVRVFQAPPHKAYDPNFQLDTETYENTAVFLLELQLKPDAPAGATEISAEVRYQTCNDKVCIPPRRRTAGATLTIDAAAHAAAPVIPAGYADVTGAPKIRRAGGAGAQGLGAFLLVAFGVGLATIFTPCVFPMIPITMSFFLNRQGTRRESLFHAVLFCLGIVVLFSGLGLVTTAALGPFGVVQLGSNPWVNGFIALVFLAFGLSLLGAFEITIPSSVLTRLDRGSQKGGIAGTLLMGLTFALSSFACVGPFMGTLLAASVGSGGVRPLAGMVAFSSGLALPFFLLALFPSYLKRLPRSGAWMARVKVVMGFIVLAAMVKYLASVDQVLQWNVITRERFLAAWIVLFAMAGLYLLGFLRLEGIAKDEPMGLGRLLTGMVFLIFAISLAPGMAGARLGELDAYIPAGAESGPGAGTGNGSALVWMKNQYREALDQARREGKLVFVNFTGYACTNCHWMKANMFTRPEIAGALEKFVLVDLYTDGEDAASQLNQHLEQTKFQTIAIPYYAILDPDENVIATFPGATRDAGVYLAFLEKGEKPATSAAVAQSAQSPAGANSPQANLAALPVTTLDGARVDTAALAGKVVVVDFWATYCVPCLKEIPTFNQLQQQYADHGVVVLGVSMDVDGGAPLVERFLKQHPMQYRVLLASEQATDLFHVNQLPTTVVFDRSGNPLQRFEGYTPADALESVVKTAL